MAGDDQPVDGPPADSVGDQVELRPEAADVVEPESEPQDVSNVLRDRIVRLERVKAGKLRPHPLNWRRHPPEQAAAMRAGLAEIGFAGAVIVRELDDGAYEIIDGHLRSELDPEPSYPCS